MSMLLLFRRSMFHGTCYMTEQQKQVEQNMVLLNGAGSCQMLCGTATSTRD
jgi:hypothetical protein